MSKTIISTLKAAQAIGPYNQAVKAGNTLYISGQLGINPENAKLVAGGITQETAQALKNMSEILAEAGLSMSDVVKTTVLLTNIENFKEMNEVYKTFFTENYPARAAYQVSKLPLVEACVEIEAIAVDLK